MLSPAQVCPPAMYPTQQFGAAQHSNLGTSRLQLKTEDGGRLHQAHGWAFLKRTDNQTFACPEQGNLEPWLWHLSGTGQVQLSRFKAPNS